MTQWKSKLHLPEDTTLEQADARAQLRLGLFSYPVLQAADILVHRATHVPVGEDQKQHLEFSRYTANSFNHLYGPIFPIPEAHISSNVPQRTHIQNVQIPRGRKIPNYPHRLPAAIQKKIKVALTDSQPNITYDPAQRPGVSNLIEMLSHFEGQSCQEIAAEFEGASLRALKEHVASRIIHHLTDIRERYVSIMDDKTGYLDSIAQQGAETAQANAAVTMRKVRDAMGL
ncbi:Tryptophan--tRNA ligase [Penicillium subrubescens]|uniref:Tryptophan--tRNA ligase n=1 Tax=Penicillium subrubescens TaxID=1316194 RepID=UPI0025455CEC|nr:Tryptophan--tRNA ligase [Penicillium subrubescens]KAJ5873587.1 Tryptophan--tRNA ligase [Penicillium subrubescens]